MAVMDWGGANSRFLGLVSVWAARSFDQTALRPSVIKRIRQIDVKYITHITSFGVTAWTRVTCMCELPRCTVHWTRISIHWILDFKQLLLMQILSKTDLTHTGNITQLDTTGKLVTTSILVLPILIINSEIRSHSGSGKRWNMPAPRIYHKVP